MGHVQMKRPGRDESDATIELVRPVGRHARDARPKPPPRHALIRQTPPPAPKTRPDHATVRLHLPTLAGHQVRARHVLVGAAILAAGLATLAGAGAAAHRVDAATPPGFRSAPASALAMPAPGRVPSILPPISSTGIYSTRPVTTVTSGQQDAPAIAASRSGAVPPPAVPPAEPAYSGGWGASAAPTSKSPHRGTPPDSGPSTPDHPDRSADEQPDLAHAVRRFDRTASGLRARPSRQHDVSGRA